MFKEDTAAFFRTQDFGVDATINDAAHVNGIFDNGYNEVLGMTGATPQFTCASAEVVGVKRNDTLVIGDANYRVQNVEPDGTGVTVLKLSIDK